MSLSKLPRELVLAVAENLPIKFLNHFLRTCRSMQQLLAPALTARLNTPLVAHRTLKWAITRRDFPTIHLALSHNAPWHSVQNRCTCSNAFLQACHLNDLDTVHALLMHFGSAVFTGTSPLHGGYCHACPLEGALRRRNIPLITLLLEHGAPANRIVFRGGPRKNKEPLHIAAKYGTAEIAELLIKHGANVHGAVRALRYATDNGSWEVGKVLLRGGVDVSSFPWSNSCPLGNRSEEEVDAWVAGAIQHQRCIAAEANSLRRAASIQAGITHELYQVSLSG